MSLFENRGTKRRLTLKQYNFILAFISNGGNATQAILSAGYDVKNYNTAKSMGWENLNKPYLKQAICYELDNLGVTKEFILAGLHRVIKEGLGKQPTNADAIKGLTLLARLYMYDI